MNGMEDDEGERWVDEYMNGMEDDEGERWVVSTCNSYMMEICDSYKERDDIHVAFCSVYYKYN